MSVNPMHRESYIELRNYLLDGLLDWATEMALNLIDDAGYAPDALKLKREDRIMEFIHDAEAGYLDEMAIVAPGALKKRYRQFRSDLNAASPTLAGESPPPVPVENRFAPAAPAIGGF